MSIILSNHNDSGSWELDTTRDYLVWLARKYINNNTLIDCDNLTRCNNLVFIKVDVLTWRLR